MHTGGCVATGILLDEKNHQVASTPASTAELHFAYLSKGTASTFTTSSLSLISSRRQGVHRFQAVSGAEQPWFAKSYETGSQRYRTVISGCRVWTR